VFHADDEPNYRSLVRVVLSQPGSGFELVGEASDGREAIELAPAAKPDVILLDINMPGMGGIEALPELRNAVPDAKIIVLTTSWRSAWEEAVRSLGGHGFIEKPRDALTLPGLIEAVIADEGEDPLDIAETMFHAWSAGDEERAWATFAPHAEFRLLEHPAPIVGVDAMRAHLDSLTEADQRGTARAIRMLGLHDAVVIEATAEVERGEVRERFPVAWTLRVRNGRIVSSRAFRSWSDAHGAAGLTASVEPTAQREFGMGAGWIFAVARRALRFGRVTPVTA
jgi:DNA-binding NarL/FixJ family response regulator